MLTRMLLDVSFNSNANMGKQRAVQIVWCCMQAYA